MEANVPSRGGGVKTENAIYCGVLWKNAASCIPIAGEADTDSSSSIAGEMEAGELPERLKL